MNQGEKHGMSKLTEEKVRFIRASSRSPKELGQLFSVSTQSIYKILSGDSWGHLPGARESAASDSIKEEDKKQVEKFPRYSVTRDGRIISRCGRRERFLKTGLDSHGYGFVVMKESGKSRRTSVHRLVAEAFVPNPDDKPQVNHINGIKTDNRAENLEWVTRSENIQHAYDTGLHKGPKNRLTDEQVRFIRVSSRSNQELADLLGVTYQVVLRVRKGLTRKNLV